MCSTPIRHEGAVFSHRMRLLLSFPLSAHPSLAEPNLGIGPCLVYESAIVPSLGRAVI